VLPPANRQASGLLPWSPVGKNYANLLTAEIPAPIGACAFGHLGRWVTSAARTNTTRSCAGQAACGTQAAAAGSSIRHGSAR
jgi:hypothetical protein